MPSTHTLAGRRSRRRFLAGVATAGAVGSVAGCLSEDTRALSLTFLRLVNTTFEHERTIDLTLSHEGEPVLKERYEEVPPSRSPRAVVKPTRPYFGYLPGGTEMVDERFSGPGTDLEAWPRQLPEAHTIALEGRHHLAEYDLSLAVSPPEFDGTDDLSAELETFEDRNRRIEDEAHVGLVVDLGTDFTRGMYPDLTFYVYETADEKSLLEDYLEAERARQAHREEFGEETVEDSPYT